MADGNNPPPPPPPLSDPQAWFAHADTSQSGALTAEQILAALLADPDYSDVLHSSIDSVRELVDAVVPVFDRDGNGVIDRDEFCCGGGMAESLLLAMEQQQAAASDESHDDKREEGAEPSSTSRGVFVPTATAVYGDSGGGAYVPTATATAAVAPSAPPMPSAPPAAAAASAPSGLWECSSCSFVNRDCASCKACGAAGGSGGSAPASAPQPRPVPVPPPAPAPAAPPARAPATTTTATTTQTLRVLIPPGTRPGQQMRVPTGGPNNESVLVAVPDQRRWQHNPSVSQQPYFDIKVQRSSSAPAVPVPAPAPAQNVASSAPPASYGGSGYGGAAGHHGGAHGGSIKPPTSIAGAAALASSILGGSMAAGGGGGGGRIPGGFSQSMPPSYHNQSMGGVPSGSHLAPISPSHVASHPTTLILKESAMSYTGDDSKIKDANGNTLFIIKAEMMSMSQRRYIYDNRGQRLGQLRRSRLLPSVHIGTLSNEKQCSVVMSGYLNPMNCNANIMLNERQKIGKISGNWRAKKFNIVIDGSVVAQVARKKTMQSMFMGADSYCIDVQPGVDLVFVSLLAISLDELYHDKKGGLQSSMGGGSPYGRPHYGGGMGGMGGMGGIFGPGF